jgi:hypothetical protein
MKKNYLFTYLLNALLLAAGCYAFPVFYGMSSLFVNDASVVCIHGITKLALLMTHGRKATLQVWSVPFRKELTDAALVTRSIAFFEDMTKYLFIAGGLGTLSVALYVLYSLKDFSGLGPKLAIAILSLLYACLLALFVSVPFRSILKQRLAEIEMK